MSETKDLEIITPRAGREVVKADDFMPLLSVEQAVDRKSKINQFIGQVLKEGDDYGKMPGDTRKDAKKVLLKPGAEKLCSIFGLAPQYLEDKITEDWTGRDHGGEPLFYYAYRCQLMRGDRFMGEAIGSANSWEIKYRYRWVTEDTAEAAGFEPDALTKRGSRATKFEPDFAIAKRESSGQYGHPAEYWDQFTAAAGAKRVTDKQLGTRKFNGWEISLDQTQYRIPNPDVADVINTLQKMAQKRALVAAVLVVTNCSDAFTQDLEDGLPGEDGSNGGTSTPAAHGAQQQTLPAEEPPLQLPEELAALFGPNAPAKGTTTAFAIVKRELMEALPQNGEDEYRRILAVNGIKDKGNKIEDVKKALIQGWTLARSVKAKTGWKPIPLTDPAGQDSHESESDDWGEGRE